MNEHLELEATSKFEDNMLDSRDRYKNIFVQKFMAYLSCIIDVQIEMDTYEDQEDFEKAFRCKKLKSIFLNRYFEWCKDIDFKQI